MLESAPDTAFESICEEFRFVAESSGKWYLKLKEPTLANETDITASIFDRIVIDYCNNSSDVDHSNTSISSVCTPRVLRTLRGVSNRPHCDWSEHVVRRYALIVKLFGEAAADTGQSLFYCAAVSHAMRSNVQT